MILNSYRDKLIAIFLVISIIPIILIGIVINNTLTDDIINEGKKIKTDYMINEADKINIWFSEKEEILKSIALNYPLVEEMIDSDNSFDKVSEYLASQVNESGLIQNIFITLHDSGKNFNSAFKVVNDDMGKRNWYKDAYNSKSIVWTQPYEDILTGKKVITVSIPVFDHSGKIDGVMGADFSFEDVANKLNNVQIGNNGGTFIIGPNKQIYTFFGANVLNNDLVKNEYEAEISGFLDTVFSNDNGNKEIIFDEYYFAAYSTVPSINWKIVSVMPRGDFYSSLVKIRNYIITAALIVLVVTIFLSILFSRIFSQPLFRLRDGAIEIQKGNYSYRVPINKNDEFDQVGQAFNNMAKELEESYDRLTTQTKELLESNTMLNETNQELQASNMQLKAATIQLNESEERYKRLIENMNDIVWVTDENHIITFINDQVYEMLGYDKKEFLGKDVREVIASWDARFSNMKNQIMEIDHKNLGTILKAKDGSEIVTEINTRRMYEGGEIIGVLGVARDITMRKSMEEVIIKRNNELVTINKISKNLNSTMNLDRLLQNATDDITKLLSLPLCAIRLLDDNNKHLKLMAKSGNLSDLVSQNDIPTNEDEAGEVIRSGEIAILNKDSRNYSSEFSKYIFESKLANYINIFPIKTRGKVVGILSATSTKDFQQSEFNILSSLTNQIAMIIENINLYQGLKNNYLKTIRTLAAAVEAKDKYTEGHSMRVSKYSRMIAEYLSLPKTVCQDIEVAGILHDIGKIGISDTILSKPGRLTEDEYNAITQHPMIGSRILENVGFSDTIMNAIKYHHKRYDLRGYPREEKLEELPLEACIIGVADAFDAMISSRSYRVAMTFESAMEELKRNKGTQFHPYIVDIMLDIYEKDEDKLKEISSTKSIAS